MKYEIDFIDGAKIKIDKDNIEGDYTIIFKDNDTNQIVYKSILKPGYWAKTNQIYFKNWNICIYYNNDEVLNYNINLKNKIVLIRMQSKSLGDSLAWIPYIEEFRNKHQCIIYFSTFLNNLFEDQYPEINFINPGDKIDNIFACYHLGWFNPFENKNPQDYKKIPLQQTASDILGLDFKEIRPKIKTNYDKRNLDYKYVCIAEFSTANAKHWHYPVTNKNEGWQKIVDWLNFNGYKVMVISKQQTNLKNIIDRTGDYPLDFRIFELQNCEFFIGIGSGLSWLAWALNKKVVMISGFSDPVCEFKEDNIRIINRNVCNSCFNKFEFDRGDWNWCPEHKNTKRQFECTTNIKPEYVVEKIIENNLINIKKGFSFNNNIKNININSNDIILKYQNDRVNILFKGEPPIDNINIDIKNDKNEIIRNLRDVQLNKSHTIWSQFNKDVDTKYFILDFFDNDNKSFFNKKLSIL